MLIDSAANPRIRAAVSLRERRERERTGLTLVDGAREVRRAVEAGCRVDTAFVCEAWIRSDEARAAVDALLRRSIPLTLVGPRAAERLAFGDRDDGIVLVATGPVPRSLADLQPGDPPFVLVTEDLEKPGNLGALLRVADGAGVAAIVTVGGTDLSNPNVIRASAGTVFSMPVASAPDAPTVLAWLRERGITAVTTRVDAERPYWTADLRGPVAIILGSEARGLGPDWAGPEVVPVRVPMRGTADSLNVATTAAILAFEVRRQRDA